MTMNPIPPQAYTRDTLVQAYAWLQNQNDSIKEIASTPDILVSLYLKYKSQGNDFLERPSIKNFKAELKNLAGLMGDLDSNPTANNQTPPLQSTHPRNPNVGSQQVQSQAQSNNSRQSAPREESILKDPSFTENPSYSSKKTTDGLDFTTQNLIREVKEMMNLSSESEALRLIVSVGHKQLKNLMKDK